METLDSQPQTQWRIVSDRDEFDEAIELIKNSFYVVVDTETFKVLHWEDRQFMGLSICVPVGETNECRYFPFGHQHNKDIFKIDNLPWDWLPEIITVLIGRALIMHNAKFDLQVLAGVGLPRPEFWYDTLIMSWMENENKRSHELEMLAPLVGAKKLTKSIDKIEKSLGGWEKIPPEVMAMYACRDAEITWKLFKRFYKSLEEQELLDDLGRENRITGIIMKMENRGIKIDLDQARRLEAQSLRELESIRGQLGYDPMKPAQLAHRLYAAPPEGLGFLPESYSARRSKEFPPGIPNMDEDILARLLCPEVEKVLRYRQLIKETSTWYSKWQTLADRDGFIHPSFKQHGTVTTRWASSGPNIQQLPRDVQNKPIKTMIATVPGYELWEFDYSQQEPRLAVVYADCKKMGEAFRNGDDLHAMTAQEIGAYNKFPDNPVKARYVGKQANLALLYTAGPRVLKWQIWHNARIDITEREAKQFWSAWHGLYPEFKAINNQAANVAEARGFVKYWNGRRRRLGNFDTHKAFNSIIQGGCAQMIIESIMMLDQEGFKIVAQVHDALWVLIPVDEVEEQKARIVEVMEWPSKEFDFPFPVDTKLMAA